MFGRVRLLTMAEAAVICGLFISNKKKQFYKPAFRQLCSRDYDNLSKLSTKAYSTYDIFNWYFFLFEINGFILN